MAKELQALGFSGFGGSLTVSSAYDSDTCKAFVETLGDNALDSARTFWDILAQKGDVGRST